MERKRLETPKKTEHTPAANRARLTRALRCRNHIDAAALARPASPTGAAS